MSPLAASFPDWLPRYLRSFQELLGVLALSDGFLLIPVEVPGPDIARILSDWLERRGVPVQVFEPGVDADWEDLATSLLRSQPPSREGVAMVIGGHVVSAGMRHGLRLLNQRRDSLSRHLGRPLLWCGPASFLDATWDAAPDFWSVRAVEQRVAPEADGGGALESLRGLLRDAQAQGDLANEARLAVHLADDLTAAGALAEAAVLVEETLLRARNQPVSVWAELAVRQARIHLARDEAERALAEMTALLRRTLPPSVADDALLVVAAAHEKAGRVDLAVEAYEQALSRALEAADPVAEIRARIGLGSNGPAAGLSPSQAVEALEAALAKARAIGDGALEAEALRALSRVAAGRHDEAGARELLDEARRRELPEYADNDTYQLAMSLDAARARRAARIAAGESTAGVDAEILALRRKLREGGQLRAGDSLGDDRYLLLRPLGRGGFSVVWEALDRRRNERVAVKVLYPQLAADPVRRERFFRGARVMSQLKDEAVVRVIEASGEDGGFHFFVMELLPGGDFRHAVLEHRLASDRVLPILLTIAGALSRAHANGLVHRDVKPGNILLDADGAPKLTDFDLVADVATTGGTRTGAMGTFLYAAPELLTRPQDADARADVYGLGMTAIFGLYGDDLPLSAVRSIDALIDRLDCTASVKSVLHKAVAWEPEDRYSDAGVFAVALRRALDEPAEPEPPIPFAVALRRALDEPAEPEPPVHGVPVSPPEHAPAPGSPPAAEASSPAGVGGSPAPSRKAGASFQPEKEEVAPLPEDKRAAKEGSEVTSGGTVRPAAASSVRARMVRALSAAVLAVLGFSMAIAVSRRMLHDPSSGLDGGIAGGPAGTSGAGGASVVSVGPAGAGLGGASGTHTDAGAAASSTRPPPSNERCPAGTLLVVGEDDKPACIDQSPVPAGDYGKCASAGKCRAARESCTAGLSEKEPAACVDWFDATAYCRWVDGWLQSPLQWSRASSADRPIRTIPGLREWTSLTASWDADGGTEETRAVVVSPNEPPEGLRVSAVRRRVTFRCVRPLLAPTP